MDGSKDNVTTYYPYWFQFEEDYNDPPFTKWMVENWTLCFIYSSVYVMLIFGGRWYMEHRPRFDLRMILVLWSGALGIFSILGTIRMIPETVHVIKYYGLQQTVCIPVSARSPAAVWCMLFAISKVVEFGDTVFIILRKQPLIFLHWYHHITVLIYTWYSYTDHTASGRWFMVMNYTVHAFMYTYYTLRALKFTIPKAVRMFITSIQLLQMVVGLAMIIWVYHIKTHGGRCQQSYSNIRWGLVMYSSYFILFAQFFYNAYMKSSISKPAMQNGIIQNGIVKNGYVNGIKKTI